jgi:hypothetical protein
VPTTLANIHKGEKYDVYIGRPSPFGNPYKIGKGQTREEVIAAYEVYFKVKIEKNFMFKRQVEALRGKVLGCYCKPAPCHGDVIVKWLDKNAPS